MSQHTSTPIIHKIKAIHHKNDAHSCILEAGTPFLEGSGHTATLGELEDSISGLCAEQRPNLPGRFVEYLAEQGVAASVQVLDPQLRERGKSALTISSRQAIENMRTRNQMHAKRPWLESYIHRSTDGWTDAVKSYARLDFSMSNEDDIIDRVVRKPLLFFYEGSLPHIMSGKTEAIDSEEPRSHLHAAICSGYYPDTDELLIITPHGRSEKSCYQRLATPSFVQALGAQNKDAIQLIISAEDLSHFQ